MHHVGCSSAGQHSVAMEIITFTFGIYSFNINLIRYSSNFVIESTVLPANSHNIYYLKMSYVLFVFITPQGSTTMVANKGLERQEPLYVNQVPL